MSVIDPRVARHIIWQGPDVGCVVGLHEEDVAMLFAMFSRSTGTIEETMSKMFQNRVLESTDTERRVPSEKAVKFHTEKTVGFGHKSVADHAIVHPFVERCSILAARDFMTARLIAATEKSTRFVDFSAVGFITPQEIPLSLVDEYENHCARCVTGYSDIMSMAVDAIRTAAGERKDPWTESGWESAIKKRALDAVRDLLPASVKTNFGMTASATSIREMLDKRRTESSIEVSIIADRMNGACNRACPTLIPLEPRVVPRELRRAMFHRGWKEVQPSVVVKPTHDWRMIDRMIGCADELINTWTYERAYHMPPDRSSEFVQYMVQMNVPFSVARDLGRHRMMTSSWGMLGPDNGFQTDPIMRDKQLAERFPQIGLLSVAHRSLLASTGRRLNSLSRRLSPVALQYACPLATSVPTVWLVSLRELVHIFGLRTTPQGAATYREIVQKLSAAVALADPMVSGIVNSCTNTDKILIGRPG